MLLANQLSKMCCVHIRQCSASWSTNCSRSAPPARKRVLEKLADSFGYDATWTYSPRAGLDGLVVLVLRTTDLIAPPSEPRLASESCGHERRLLHVELHDLHVLLVYAPNSGRPGRLAFRIQQWEPSMRELIRRLLSSAKPVLLQGDLKDTTSTRDADAKYLAVSSDLSWKPVVF